MCSCRRSSVWGAAKMLSNVVVARDDGGGTRRRGLWSKERRKRSLDGGTEK